PIEGFLQFHQTKLKLGAIFRSRSSARGFSIICSNRSSGAQQLVANHLGHLGPRKGGEDSNDSKGIISRTLLQVSRWRLCLRFVSHDWSFLCFSSFLFSIFYLLVSQFGTLTVYGRHQFFVG